MGFNFPDAPTIGQAYTGYVWNGESWQVQGGPRSGLSSVKKNYIINGAMMVSQENGTTAGTTTNYWPVDQFNINASNAGTQTVQQVASPTPGGSPNRLRVTATVADASVAAGDISWLQTALEALRTADLRFGSASAKTVTLQFGVKAPAGTYSVVFCNGAINRSYVAEYVIAAGEANTDVIKSVVIPGDVTGTWATDNTAGIIVRFALMAGTTYQQAAGSWAAVGIMVGSPNQFNFMGTGGNVFELFDVSLTEGSVAPPFVVPDYASELAACSRYFQLSSGSANFNASSIGQSLGNSLVFVPPMRSSPTTVLAAIGPTTNLSGGAPSIVGANTLGARYEILSAAAGQCYALMAIIKCNARL